MTGVVGQAGTKKAMTLLDSEGIGRRKTGPLSLQGVLRSIPLRECRASDALLTGRYMLARSTAYPSAAYGPGILHQFLCCIAVV